ncbi:hypothetical protein ACFQHV_02475 [Promicromonospora thailandica]|uniref:Uncharacterized protein n=1 Tax=Promicromonospora thailandica TaxID=765201 RepID=A0A9X2K0B4_9MICO|nr:hypothetical protein [Promicromonospora thailandica]MCP2266929.1 hypothetical protein [Promicromonospora thailandica]BFF16803.1 hypothetical protein GCM10025730_03240 [Promicromonospora thailandica]
MTDAAQHPATVTPADRAVPSPTTSPVPEAVPLGAAPRPVDGADLAARVRETLAQELGERVAGLDRATVTTVLDGADVTSARIDLSGVVVRFDGTPAAPGPGQVGAGGSVAWRPDVVRREPATLRHVRLDAHRLVVVDLPVDVTAELSGLRFDWVEGADGRVGAEPVEPSAEHPVSGHARVAVDKDGLVATVRGILAVVLLQQGITLTGLDLDLTSTGPRSATLRVDAAIKKGIFLSARVQATASVSVDADMVLAVRDVQLTSGNPLVAALLGTVKGRVDAATARDIDLGARLPEGVRLADVRLDVGQELTLTARLA